MYIPKLIYMKMLSNMKLILNVAKRHYTMTVLLEYVDLFTTCVKIMIGTYYPVDINALPSLKVN